MKKPAKGETGHIINAYRITGSLEKRQNTVYLWRTSELLDLNLNIPDPAMHLLWGIRLLGKLIFTHLQYNELFTSCRRWINHNSCPRGVK